MKNNLRKLLVILVLGMAFNPATASANYVQPWVENGLYGSPAAYQTWDKVEAFLITDGAWEETGLSNFSAAGWTATLVAPKYAVATGPVYNSAVQGNFYYSTTATALTDPFTFDWILWKADTIVGFQRTTYTPASGWTYVEYTKDFPAELRPITMSGEPPAVPIPPSVLLLGSGLVGLLLLRRRQRTAN